jgi:4-amino-4-deoxy-L-arabinose transferase-like glycosyltransferase
MKRHWKPGDGTIAILLAILTAIILAVTAPAIGVTTDEPTYITAGESYAEWIWLVAKDPVRAFNSDTIDFYWNPVHEHPPVEKTWSGLIWLGARHFLDETTANRLGPILLVGLLAALLYLMVAEKNGRPAGFFAVAALMLMPRFFFHAHLAALDVPVAVASFAVTFVFWKTIQRQGWAWGLLLGVTWGLAVGVKHNAVLVPVALGLWCLAFKRKWTIALRFLIMGLTAISTFILVWPWLYHQTWTRLLDYANFQLNHYGIGQWYLGQASMPPPWHYVFVILWAVVPLTVMLLFLTGSAAAGNGKRDGGLAWLLILGAFVSISPFIFGKILAYDGERLFMPVFPFMAALAGIGFARVISWLKRLAERYKRPRWAAPAVFILGIALLAPQLTTMTRLYPHLISYYSEGVGGLPGATRLGLETTYWCEVFSAALPIINANAKPGDVIWSEDNDVLLYYQSTGQLRRDVKFLYFKPIEAAAGQQGEENFRKVNWYILDYRQSQYGSEGAQGYLPMILLGTQKPIYELSFEGVPLMKLYNTLK